MNDRIYTLTYEDEGGTTFTNLVLADDCTDVYDVVAWFNHHRPTANLRAISYKYLAADLRPHRS